MFNRTLNIVQQRSTRICWKFAISALCYCLTKFIIFGTQQVTAKIDNSVRYISIANNLGVILDAVFQWARTCNVLVIYGMSWLRQVYGIWGHDHCNWSVCRLRSHYIPNSFSCRHEKLSGIVWTATVQNWNKCVPVAGCPVPFFFYFLSLFLFSPIFKLKPPIFPIFLTGEAKICNKKNWKWNFVVCVLEWDLSKSK